MATENPSALWSLTTAAARAQAQPWLQELAKEGIRKTCQHLAAAWSRGDVAGLGDILAIDCDHLTLARVRQMKRGRAELVNSWASAFARRSAEFSVRMTAALHSIRLLKDDLALVDGDLEYSSGIGPGGTLQGRCSQPFAAVMARVEGDWMIQSMRVGAAMPVSKIVRCEN